MRPLLAREVHQGGHVLREHIPCSSGQQTCRGVTHQGTRHGKLAAQHCRQGVAAQQALHSVRLLLLPAPASLPCSAARPSVASSAARASKGGRQVGMDEKGSTEQSLRGTGPVAGQGSGERRVQWNCVQKDNLPRRNSLRQLHSKQLKRLVPDSLCKGLDGWVGPAGCRCRPFERLPPILGQVGGQRGIVELRGAREWGTQGRAVAEAATGSSTRSTRGPPLCIRAAAAAQHISRTSSHPSSISPRSGPATRRRECHCCCWPCWHGPRVATHGPPPAGWAAPLASCLGSSRPAGGEEERKLLGSEGRRKLSPGSCVSRCVGC